MTTTVSSSTARRFLPSFLRDAGRLTHRRVYVLSAPVLNACAIAAGLMIPGLLGPAEFGVYVVAELFARYLVIADLGLGQVLDRRIPPLVASGDGAAAEQLTQQILWARIMIAGACGSVVMGLTCYLALSGALGIDLPAALLAAAFGMFSLVAAGPVSAWRAASNYQPFSLASIFLNAGLSLPRILGAWLGGVAGCFAALAAWYGLGAALVHARLPLRRSTRPSLRMIRALLVESLPLFAAGFGWAVYLVENRLVYAMIAGPAELGQFAFGAAILTVLVTTLALSCNVYYPKLAGDVARAAPFALSARLLRDLFCLAVAGFVCSAIAILLVPETVRLLYPRYVEAVPATRLLLVSGLPVGVSSWLMPIVVAVGRRPWVDAISIFPASLLAVAAGIVLGSADGMEGAALGSVAGTLLCPMLQLIALRRSSVMLLRHVVVLSLLIAMMTAMLAAAVLLTGSG